MILPKTFDFVNIEEDIPRSHKKTDGKPSNLWIGVSAGQVKSDFDIEEMKKSMPLNAIAQKLKAEGLTLLQTGKLLYPTCCCGSKNEINALKQKVRRLILKK